MRGLMYTVVVVAAVVLSGGALTSGMLIRDGHQGTCPEVVNKQDFDAVPYLGRWYEDERFNIIFQAGMDCVQAIYSLNDDGSVLVHNTARGIYGEFVDAFGRAEVTEPGVLLVSFPNNVKAEYHILDTDYENFTSIYNCVQEGPIMFEYAWILSRAMTLDEASMETARQAFINNGLDLDRFHATYQGEDCPYEP